MAGVGPRPKDPNRRARGNRDIVPLRVIEAQPVRQPDLPEFDIQVKIDGVFVTQEFYWPEQTRRWWTMWSSSPLSSEFTETDWDFLLDTALIHAKLWNGDMSAATELRLRVAKFGATPEDRARLRISFATADETDDRVKRRRETSEARRRRGPLTEAG